MSFAASRGHGRVVRTLLDLGADPKVYSNDGQTASDIAYSNEYHAVSSHQFFCQLLVTLNRTVNNKKKCTFYLSVDVFSTKVLIGDTIFYVS